MGFADADGDTYDAITQRLAHWDDIHIHYRGERIVSTGHGQRITDLDVEELGRAQVVGGHLLAVMFVPGRTPVPRVVSHAWPFHFDDFRPQERQLKAAERTRQHIGQVDDADAFEWLDRNGDNVLTRAELGANRANNNRGINNNRQALMSRLAEAKGAVELLLRIGRSGIGGAHAHP